MSKSFLPPEVGVSTKVVFVGVEPGSAEAQRLYAANAGAISHFHSKARQARGDRPSAHMHQTVPGGKLTYSFNNGLEIVTVELTPETERTRSEPFVPPVPPEPILAPLLAIDVLFDPEKFEVGEVFSKSIDSTIIMVPDPEADQSDPGNWDLASWTRTELQTIASIMENYGSEEQGGYQDISVLGTMLSNDWPADISVPGDIRGSLDAAPPYKSGLIYEVMAATISNPTTGDLPQFTRTFWMARWEGDVDAAWVGPRVPEEEEGIVHERELRTYFDILAVVGARVEADPNNAASNAYEASSAGSSDDPRLVLVNAGAKTISRTLAISGEGDPGFVGHCFVAQPRSWPPPPNEAPTPIEIKLYAASYNVSQRNSFPGEEGSEFDRDDPSMTYEAKPTLNVKVRAREFIGPSPIGVMVSLSAEGLVERWRSPTNDAYPDQPDGTQTIAGARTEEWAFAATPTWQDGGNEPADPTAIDAEGASTMGELLGEAGYSTVAVTGPDPFERAVPTEPSWSRPVTAMTQIGYVIWTPPGENQEHGTAEVELF